MAFGKEDSKCWSKVGRLKKIVLFASMIYDNKDSAVFYKANYFLKIKKQHSYSTFRNTIINFYTFVYLIFMTLINEIYLRYFIFRFCYKHFLFTIEPGNNV